MSDIHATYLIDTNQPKQALTAICRGQSVGNPSILTSYETRTFLTQWAATGKIERDSHEGLYVMVVNFPQANFGTEGVNYLLSVLLGGQCDIDLIRGCRLMELNLGNHARHFPRPSYGIHGLRELLHTPHRAFVGGIIKPKIGLTLSQLVDVVKQLADGGCDIIKEDELLADQYWCPMRLRLPAVAKALSSYHILYLTCITGDGSEVWQKARLASKLGATGVHLNLWCGLGTYLDVARHVRIPIHFQKSGDKVWTTGAFSMDAAVLCQLVNLVGCDMAHVGMYGGYLSEPVAVLKRRMEALRTTLPTFSCGMTPHVAEHILQIFGTDLACFSGGWIHGGTDIMGRVKELRRVVDATSQAYRLQEGLVPRELQPEPVADAPSGSRI